jgi:hypothetical protein
MPYKIEKIKINDPFLDRRIKLIPCQIEMINLLHGQGWSQRKLASRFKVSRRLITFILFPEKREKNYQKRVLKGGSMQYYNKEKHTIAIRETRQYKHKILKNDIKNLPNHENDKNQ